MANPIAKKIESPKGAQYRPLRVWPAILLIVAMILIRFLPSLFGATGENVMMAQAMGPAVCGGLILIWWLCISRAMWFERIVGTIGIVIVVFLVDTFVSASMEGIGLLIIAIPMGMAAFGIGAVLFRNCLGFRRTIFAVLLATIGFGFTTLLRADGMWSDAKLTLHWRWTPTNEDILVEEKRNEPKSVSVISPELASGLVNPEWPAFRGGDRTSRHRGALVSSQLPRTFEPVWKISVGPSWSSFAVAGNLLFTQEQRGDNEAVVCYDARSGKELWIYEVKTRFEETIGGPGPRATPTLAMVATADGSSTPSLFSLGANGTLVRLDPMTGKSLWEQELQKVADREPPTWGFSSSPLVVGSNVIVHAGGTEKKGTLAFDVSTGDLVWSAVSGDHSYGSPQLSEILGEDLILMSSNNGLEILDPADGSMRLNYEWKSQGYRALQPQVFGGDTVVIASGIGTGSRRIKLTRSESSGNLDAEEVWTSMNLKPDFNDYVAFDGHLYGFDGSIFTCIDLETGKRTWKGGRYGKGQVLLLEESGMLLVASEKGEVVLLKTDPNSHNELARFQAIDGKTWNHPVVVGDRLFIRNGQEAACFQLPTDGTQP